MSELAVLLLVPALAFALARWKPIPIIPLLIFGGILLMLAGFAPEEELNRNALELGLAFLLFAAGIELNPSRFGKQWRAALWIGLAQFLLAGVAGLLAARLFLPDWRSAMYIGLALSTSSTLVVLRHLQQLRQLFEPFGRLVIGVLLFQDLLMIFIIVGLAGAPGGFTSASLSLIYMLALCCLALVCQRWVFPLLITRVQLDQEILLLIILAVLFAFIGLADVLSLPTVAGAFLGGFSLSAFPVNGVVRGLLRSLSDFFMAIFFTILGLMVVIPDMAFLFQAILLAALVVLFTPPLVTAVAEWKGFSSRSAIESGLLLAQTSEFSLVIGLLGLRLEHIDQEIFSLLVVVTAITMILTPLIATDGMTRRLLHWHPLRRRMKPRPAKENHILMLGFGTSGMWVIKPLQARGHEVLVVEDDPIVVEQLQSSNIPWVRGDASDEKTLAQAGARRARLIICALRRVSDAQKVIQYSRGVPVIVRVFEQEDAEQIRRWGGIPIVNAHAAADTFMEWFEKSFRP